MGPSYGIPPPRIGGLSGRFLFGDLYSRAGKETPAKWRARALILLPDVRGGRPKYRTRKSEGPDALRAFRIAGGGARNPAGGDE